MSEKIHHPDWDDEELVPMDNLRPSRRHFGPLPDPNEKARKFGANPANPRANQARDPRDRQRSHRADPPRRSEQSRKAEPPRRNEPPRRAEAPRAGQPRRREEAPRRVDAQRRPEGPDPRREQELRRDPRSREPVVVVKPGGDPKPKVVDPRAVLQRPLTDATMAVFSRKGGVGKTTITAYLGLTLLTERGGRILAIDGDAEAGSLGWMLSPQSPAMLGALSMADPVPDDYEEISRYAAQTPDGLEVIVGDTDGEDAVDPAGLERVLVEVGRNYDMSIFDTGGGASVSASRALVRSARVLFLVMGPSVDSVRAAERTLAWLEERPGEATRKDVQIIAVINGIPETMKEAHIEHIEKHFASRCAAVARIPWDEHLAAGVTEVALNQLSKATRRAFVQLAVTTVSVLSRSGSRKPMEGARRVS